MDMLAFKLIWKIFINQYYKKYSILGNHCYPNLNQYGKKYTGTY